MAVVIESSVWEPYPWLYILIFSATICSIFLPARFFKRLSAKSGGKASNVFENGVSSSSFPRFCRNFLLLYHLVSVLEGLGLAFGEFELARYGLSRERLVSSLAVGQAASLFFGTLLGLFSDIIGQKKICLIFCILHVFIGLWKRIVTPPSIFANSICLSLSASIFSFSFETWMINQHEEQGYRRDTLNEVYWLMSFFESASLIEGQVLSNWFIGNNVEKNILSPSTLAVFLAIIGMIYITKGWSEVSQRVSVKQYEMSLHTHIFGDKRIWLLAWAQACLHFSTSIFWILWAPTVVADGREVHLGLMYACLVGSRMLGSTIFPWLTRGLLSTRTEDYLVCSFGILGLVLSITAYDYQEIIVLLGLFCLFQASVGLILPSLTKLRTLYVPNQLRGGMISLSQAPAHAAILLFLVLGRRHRYISNATIMNLAALGLFTSAVCMYMLKRLGKQPYQNGDKL